MYFRFMLMFFKVFKTIYSMLLRVKDTEKITVSGYEQAKSYQRILI